MSSVTAVILDPEEEHAAYVRKTLGHGKLGVVFHTDTAVLTLALSRATGECAQLPTMTLALVNSDPSIGNLIRCALAKDTRVSFAAMSLPHVLQNITHVRIALSRREMTGGADQHITASDYTRRCALCIRDALLECKRTLDKVSRIVGNVGIQQGGG